MSHKIENYIAPSNHEMAELREALGYTQNQMAGLVNLDVRQWRKIMHNDADKSVPVTFTNLFHMAAVLHLRPSVLEGIYDKMRELGAEFDVTEVQVGRADRQ